LILAAALSMRLVAGPLVGLLADSCALCSLPALCWRRGRPPRLCGPILSGYSS
jgi:hypothetical protein